MQKIDFVNAQEPAINDTNLNQMQLNIENAINAQVSGDTLPIGCIVPFTSDTVPENWLLCNGIAISRTEYALLFSIIGTTYGVGDGSTTFNLPDLRGRVAVGKDGTQTEFDNLGEKGGEKTHQLTVGELPKHTPKVKYLGEHGTGLNSGPYGYKLSYTLGCDESLTTEPIGNDEPHNILQPYQVTNYIIKARQSSGIVATVVDGLNSTSTTDALSANQGRILNQTMPKLIYNKVTTENDANGFTTTDFQFEDGKMYKIFVNGTLKNLGGTSIYNIIVDFNNVTPTLARNTLFGTEAGNIVNMASDSAYLRIARTFSGYGCQSEILVTYRDGYIRANGHYNCTSSGIGISTNIETILGSYVGTLTSFKFSCTENQQIQAGTIIKIFEMPQ